MSASPSSPKLMGLTLQVSLGSSQPLTESLTTAPTLHTHASFAYFHPLWMVFWSRFRTQEIPALRKRGLGSPGAQHSSHVTSVGDLTLSALPPKVSRQVFRAGLR